MQLLRSAPELLTKHALFWYRMQEFSSWEELVRKLREDFLPYEYEHDLWEENCRRTQGATEKVIIYISSMENLFKKLGSNRPIESERVRLIRRNMLPYIQTQMAFHPVIATLSELSKLSRTAEETSVKIQNFLPPPTNTRRLLQPELAYRGPSESHKPHHTVTSVEAIQPLA